MPIDDLPPPILTGDGPITAVEDLPPPILPDGIEMMDDGTITERIGSRPSGTLANVYPNMGSLRKELMRREDTALGEQLNRLAAATRLQEQTGPLANVVAGAAGSIDSTRRALGIGEASESDAARSVQEASQELSPGIVGDLQRGAGGLIADIPLMIAGGPVAQATGGIRRVRQGGKALRAMLTTAAAVQPLALREGITTAQDHGVTNGIGAWAIETVVPSLFGKTGTEKAIIGRMPWEQAQKVMIPRIRALMAEGGIEMADEAATEIAHAAHEYASGMDPNALDPARLGRRLAVAAALGGAAGVGFNAPDAIAEAAQERQMQQRTLALDALRAMDGAPKPATADPVQVDERTATLGKALAPVLGPEESARVEAGRAIEASAANDTALRRQRMVRALADEAADISADRRAGMESLAKSESEAARRRELSAIADDAAASMNPEDQELPPEAGASERIVAEGRAPDARPVDDERKRFDTLARIRTETDQRHQLRVNATNARRQAGQIGKAQAAQEKAASDRQRLAEYGEAAQAVADGRPLPSWSALSTQEATDAQEDPQPRTGVAPGPVPVPGSAGTAPAPSVPANVLPSTNQAPTEGGDPRAKQEEGRQGRQGSSLLNNASEPAGQATAGGARRLARVVPAKDRGGYRVAIGDGIRPVRFLRPGYEPGSAQESQTWPTAAEAEAAARESLGDRWDVGMSDQAKRADAVDAQQRQELEAGRQDLATVEDRARSLLQRAPDATHTDLLRELPEFGFRVDAFQKLPAGAETRGLRLKQELASRGEDLRGMFDRVKRSMPKKEAPTTDMRPTNVAADAAEVGTQGMPDELRKDMTLLAQQKAHHREVSTPGATVRPFGQDRQATVISSNGNGGEATVTVRFDNGHEAGFRADDLDIVKSSSVESVEYQAPAASTDTTQAVTPRDELDALESKYRGPFGPANNPPAPGTAAWNNDHARMDTLREMLGRKAWQRTRAQVWASDRMPEEAHRSAIEKAQKEGKNIPDHVLAEYPELSADKSETPTTSRKVYGGGTNPGAIERGPENKAPIESSSDRPSAINEVQNRLPARSASRFREAVMQAVRDVAVRIDDGETGTVSLTRAALGWLRDVDVGHDANGKPTSEGTRIAKEIIEQARAANQQRQEARARERNGGTGMTESQAAAPMDDDVPFRLAPDTAPAEFTGTTAGDIAQAFGPDAKVTARGPGSITVRLPNGATVEVMATGAISTSTAGAVAKGGAIVFRKNGAVVGRIMLVKGQTTAGTLPHEQYHIARGMGIITNAEHSELARAAAALFNRNPSLDGTPLQETLKLYQQNAKDSGRGPASVQEEMVAVAREYWAANPSEAPGANRSVWQKVTDFFRDLVAGLGLRAADARKILADLDSGRTWRRSPTSGEGGGMSVRPRWTPSAEKGGGFPLPKESSDSAEPATNKAGLRVREYVIAPHGGVDWGRLPAAKARELGIPVMPIRVQNGWNSRFNNGFGLEHVSERHGKEIARETGKPVEQFLQDAIDDMGSADIRPDGKEFVAVVPTQGARMVLTLINKDGALVVHSARPLYPHDMKKTAAGRPSQPRGNQPSAPPASSTPAVADGEGSRPVRTPSDGMIPEDGAGGNKMPQGDDAGGDTGSVRYSLAPSGVSLQAATPLGAPVTVGQNLPMLAPEKPRLRGFFRGFMRKYLTVASNLPKDAAARAFSMNHRITAMVDQLSYVERDYQKALKKAYAGKPSAADIEKINEVLRGNAPLSSVPVEMEPVLIQMRGLVDGLSREGIRSGLFQGDLAAKVAGNLGTYLHRSYAVHDDPAWAKKVPPQVLNRARSFIQAQNPNMTPEEVNGVIEEILHPDAAGGMHAGSMLGSKKLGFTKERKQIPEEIRDLMGEYKNPFVNFAKSFANMAAAVEQHKFLTDIRDNGMGVYFHQQPTKRDGVSFSAKIAGDTSKALDPLNGLYTTPEIAEAFREYRSSGWGRDGAHGAIWRTLATLNGITKQAKTVGNFPGGHIRNFLGNVLIAVGNGHLNMLHGLETRRYFSAETGMFGDNEKSREFVRRLTELGVVGAGFSGGEFRQLVRDAVGKSAEDFAAGTAKRMAMKPVNFLQGSYDLMDAFWRINGFLNERRALEKARPGMSDQALDEEAAKRVNDMYPTYERIAKVVQDLRKLPMIGTFTGFITEMARVSKNLIKYAAQDLQTPGMRSIGARRLVGTITAMSVPLAIAAISRSLANVDDDDEEALRRLAMPEWSRNSTIVWLPKDENGNQRYIDLSWTDPYSFMRDPLRALMSGRPKDAAVEALEPYLGWSLLAKAGIEAYMGNTASGRPIRRQGNTDAENAAATIGHIWKAFEPGTVGMLRRQYKAATGTTEDSGRNYQLDDEILAPLTGMRVGSADPWQALRFRGFDIARRWSDGRAQLRKAQQRSGATREDMNDAAERWDTVRGEIADDAAAIYTDAMRLGVTPKSAGAILSKAGVTGDAALAISIAVAKKARGDE